MSQNVTWNGIIYIIPEPGDVDWGQNVTDFLIAVPAGALQKTGGSFTLTADVDFGATYGLKAVYLKSRGSNIATAGLIRVENNATGIAWRNAANSGNLPLAVNSSDELTFDGVPIGQSSNPLYWRSRCVTLDDFTSVKIDGADIYSEVPWQIVDNNGTVSILQPQGANPGVLRLESNTGGTDFCSIYHASPGFVMGAGATLFDAVFRLPVASTGAAIYRIAAGLFSDTSFSGTTDGIWFQTPYSGADLTKFNLIANYTGFGTTSIGPVSAMPVSATDFFRLTISVNTAGTAVEWQLNGVVIGSADPAYVTDLPLMAGVRIANVSGASPKVMDVDLVCVDKSVSPAR